MFILDWIRNLISWPILLALLFAGVFGASGCTITGRHDGELYATFGTTISLGHRTAQSADVEDTVSIHSQPLEDWVSARANTPAKLDPETEVVGGKAAPGG